MTSHLKLLAALLMLGIVANAGEPALPNPTLTPGAVMANLTLDSIVTPGFVTHNHLRDVSQSTKHRVFISYFGYKPSAPYVIDHLIPLSLGGSNETKNLWPQPVPEAKRKDKLARQMAVLLRECYKQQGPKAAAALLTKFQAEISTDWQAAFSKYCPVQ